MRALLVLTHVAVAVVAGRDVDLAAEYGLDAPLFGAFIKIDHAVHNTVVGEGQRAHVLKRAGVHQLVEAARTVQ